MSGHSISFELDGPDPVEWEALVTQGRNALGAAARFQAEAILDDIRASAPRGQSSESLADSWSIEQLDEFSWRLVSSAPHAPFVSQGTAPHEILPVSASVLVFEVQGQTVYARRVEHPGTQLNPYVETAIERAGGRLDEFMERGLREAGVS